MPANTAQGRTYNNSPRRTASTQRRAETARKAPGWPAENEWLTVDEFCTELKIGRRTFERWRSRGIAPRADRPTRNGPLRMRRIWIEQWIEARG